MAKLHLKKRKNSTVNWNIKVSICFWSMTASFIVYIIPVTKETEVKSWGHYTRPEVSTWKCLPKGYKSNLLYENGFEIWTSDIVIKQNNKSQMAFSYCCKTRCIITHLYIIFIFILFFRISILRFYISILFVFVLYKQVYCLLYYNGPKGTFSLSYTHTHIFLYTNIKQNIFVA